MNDILAKLKKGLIVSCQALENEPLYSSYIMSKMSYAVMLGGAKGIRGNSVEDIMEIKKVVNLPVIGIIKKEYPDSEVYITPTFSEVESLVGCNCDIIAIDATNRIRPRGETLETLIKNVRKAFPDQLLMADCATHDEGVHAAEIGFDIVGTTLCGYTEETKNVKIPNFDLIERLSKTVSVPVIAEGGIWSTEDLRQALKVGAFAAVIGTAITRPMDITKRYVESICDLN